MPIYEYRCPKCGLFDHMQKITEPPLKRCPTCKGKVTKLMSNSAFHLKGGGWYITDYARKGSSAGESASAGDGGSSGDGKASDKKGDTASSKGDSASAVA